MHNGCILCGGTGSGKSLTALGYFYKTYGGDLNAPIGQSVPMSHPADLLIITTPKKRDGHEWEREMAHFCLSPDPEANFYSNRVLIDSWNNIKKYAGFRGGFVIFDEQHVTGKGPWVDAFLALARWNQWILLSATPGDAWIEYVPVFIANGFYRNRTQFKREHVIQNPHVSYESIQGYYNEGKLERLRASLLVPIDYKPPAEQHHIDEIMDYNRDLYRQVSRSRFSAYRGEPLRNAADLCGELRRITNSDPSRLARVIDIVRERRRVVLFYNYDYELEALRSLAELHEFDIREWNGHKHEQIPDSDSWLYLVNYNAGADAWNCIKTNTMIFYSQNHSYKIMTQAAGRIDRANTPYRDLYYYHFKSRSPIDKAIDMAYKRKKDFNENRFFRRKYG